MEKTRKSLKPKGTRPGVMYASYKVHKTCVDNCPPFGLFLSALNTPTYKLAKILVPNLKPLTTKNLFILPKKLLINNMISLWVISM